MDEQHFWDIIARACKSDLRDTEDWDRRLREELEKLQPGEILEWDQIFERLCAQAYTSDLWRAARIINCGASEDGFLYFRCWLIGMGRGVYEAAIANADNLADVVYPDLDAQSEIYTVASAAWTAVTGKRDMPASPSRNENAKLKGEDWDLNDAKEVRNRFPRLAATYRK